MGEKKGDVRNKGEESCLGHRKEEYLVGVPTIEQSWRIATAVTVQERG
jgi:hypothetical protein